MVNIPARIASSGSHIPPSSSRVLPGRKKPLVPNPRVSKTTPTALARLAGTHHIPPAPPYPYGLSQWYKKSDHGLYGGQRIQFGNNVTGKYEVRTRRTWHPNVQYKKLWSDALNRWIKLNITTRVLRTVDKCGGLDAYLLGDSTARIKELGPVGWKLRWHVQYSIPQRMAVAKENLRAQGVLFEVEGKRQSPKRRGETTEGSDQASAEPPEGSMGADLQEGPNKN